MIRNGTATFADIMAASLAPSYDPGRDSFDSYNAAIAALRMREVMRGALPRENEPVCIFTMAALT